MCFFPQENTRELQTYRNQLTPFLKSVMEALNIELENNEIERRTRQRKKTLCEEIIRGAGSLTTVGLSQSLPNLSTLRLEHDQLALNLRLDNFVY